MNTEEAAKYLIENNVHMTVATANEDGKPWVSPVFYNYDQEFNLYWVSSKNAVHSRNIRLNPEVAIVIFGPIPPNNDIDGVYFDAEAIELTEEKNIQQGIKIMCQRDQPDKFMIKSPEDVTSSACWRIYKATPKEIYKRTDAVDDESGQAITIREAVEF